MKARTPTHGEGMILRQAAHMPFEMRTDAGESVRVGMQVTIGLARITLRVVALWDESPVDPFVRWPDEPVAWPAEPLPPGVALGWIPNQDPVDGFLGTIAYHNRLWQQFGLEAPPPPAPPAEM